MSVPSLNIALVEDHADLRDLFIDFLSDEGHTVTGFPCADELDEFLPDHHVDLLVLDLNLPGEDGFSIAQRMRLAHPAIYIIMITARTALEDRIRGYSSGADVYLAKPVAPTELGASVGSIARRVRQAQVRSIEISIDTRQMELAGPAARINLTPPEALLLKALAEASGRKLDYWRLYELLQLDATDRSKSMLEVRISRLKKKLHEAGAPEPAIKSLWKTGYQLCVSVSVRD
jgi:DNA-binding response OmpR family regulator